MNIFSSKLSTLYPGYVLKGEVHHSMRAFKEEERSVLVSVRLMKGIYRVEKIEKKAWATCANYWQRVLYMKAPQPCDSDLKERFLSFCLFVCLFVYLFIYFAIRMSRFILFTFFGYPLFFLFSFSHPHPPSASTIRRYPIRVLQTPSTNKIDYRIDISKRYASCKSMKWELFVIYLVLYQLNYIFVHLNSVETRDKT